MYPSIINIVPTNCLSSLTLPHPSYVLTSTSCTSSTLHLPVLSSDVSSRLHPSRPSPLALSPYLPRRPRSPLLPTFPRPFRAVSMRRLPVFPAFMSAMTRDTSSGFPSFCSSCSIGMKIGSSTSCKSRALSEPNSRRPQSTQHRSF